MLLDSIQPRESGAQIGRTSPENKGSENRPVALEQGQLTGKWITPNIVRVKQPGADLQRSYRKVMNICMGITFLLYTAVAVAFPKFESDVREIKRVAHMIEVQDLPETQQIKRPPPPPRPAVPIETESDDIPDDVTIESTDLDFDDAMVNLPPPPPPGSGDSEDNDAEIIEFWAVEQAPQPIKQAAPLYPEVA